MSSADDVLDALDSAFRDPTVSPGAMRHVPPRDDEWDLSFDEPGSHLTWETARFDGNMLDEAAAWNARESDR